ncbi:DUF6965 family protein [Chitinophaga niabensis]|uniref:DUF6965 family protein n=1 Tax=Chitinophaga niabensis TaxID=536979 RepID=UPI000940AC06
MTANEYHNKFQDLTLPPAPVKLFPGVIVTDVHGFIEKSLNILRSGQHKRVTDPIEVRLKRLIEIIEQQNKA